MKIISKIVSQGGAGNDSLIRARRMQVRLERFALGVVLGIVLMAGGGLAADITINTATTGTNGSTTFPGNNNPLADGQKLTVTRTGSVTTNAPGEEAIFGGEYEVNGITVGGRNTILIQNGARLTSTGADTIHIGGDGANFSVIGIDPAMGITNTLIQEAGSTITCNSSSNNYGIAVGANVKVTANGTIVANGPNASGLVTMWNNNIAFGGSITTNGNESRGLAIALASAVTVDGTIWCNGNDAHPLLVYMTNAIAISSNARINTNGSGSSGVYVFGSENFIANYGVIATSGINAHGIHYDGSTMDPNSYVTTDRNTLLAGGTITTSGANASGIYIGSNRNAITAFGTITTGGSAASGIIATGNKNAVNANGAITTTGDMASGLSISGSSNTVTFSENATITTSGSNAFCISVSGVSNTITSGGTITTSGPGASGISASGSNNTIAAGKKITTSGNNAPGVSLSGNSNTLNANGAITTTGSTAYGISASGNNNTLTESGTITTSGASASGVSVSGNSNTLTESGTITTSGASASGVSVSGNSNTLTENGTIATSGASASGIAVSGSSNTLTVGGAITTSGGSASGISASGSGNTLTVAKTITTSGATAHGVSVQDSNSVTLASTGTIRTTGTDADGIKARTGNTLVVNGSITTTGNYNNGGNFDWYGANTGGDVGSSGNDSCGINVFQANRITVTGAVAVSGTNIDAVDAFDNYNVSHISGALSATGSGGNAIVSGNNYSGAGYAAHTETNLFHLLNGAAITGNIHNRDSNGNATSYLTFGFAKTSGGNANLAAADDAFRLICNGNITSNSTGKWDGYLAGGTTTLNGTTNDFRNLYVGGDGFISTALFSGQSTATAINRIAGATATLNATNTISTSGVVKIGAGSTYNLSGTHTHTGTAFDVGGTLLLSSAASLSLGTSTTNLAGTINNGSYLPLYVAKLTVDSGNTGTIRGSSTVTATTANINGTLAYAATTDNTIGTANLAGTLNQSSANKLTVTNLNVASGSTGTLAGSGAGAVKVTNAPTINGTLNVNRAVAFANNITSLGSAGKLSGTGTVAGNVTTGGNGGTIAPGGGSTSSAPATLAVIGNVTINTGDTVALGVMDSGTNKLDVTGDATFDNGAKILVNSSSIQVNTTSVVLATSGSLTDNGAQMTVQDSSYTLDTTAQITPGAAGKVTVAITQSPHAYQNAATGQNPGMGAVLDRLATAQPAEMAPLFTAMNRMSSAGEVDAAMTQLGAFVVASALSQVGMSAVQQSNHALSGQFDSLRTATLPYLMNVLSNSSASSGREAVRASAGGVPTDPEAAEAAKRQRLIAALEESPYDKWDGFVKAYGGFGQEGSSGNATGYDFGGAGVMTGLDYAFSPELRTGWLIDYSYNRSNLYNNLGSATDNILRTGPFGSWNWDNLFVDTAPTFGIHMLESQRNINFLNTAARGERTGFDFNWMNTTGYRFDLPKEFMLTPSYGLGFTTMYDPQYTETGAAGGSNLLVREFTNYSLLQNLDLKLGRIWRINRRLGLLPEVWGGWEHEYLSDGGDVTTAFAAAPTQSWTSAVNTISADRSVFGAGLTTLISDRWSVFGRYDQKLWKEGFSTNFSTGLRVSF